MKPYLGRDVEVIDKGALDNIDENEIASLVAREEGAFITKLKSGRSITIAKNNTYSILLNQINTLNQLSAQSIILACTGSFPKFITKCPIIYPDKMLLNFVKSLDVSSIGVIFPLAEQEDHIKDKWKNVKYNMYFSPASPYHDITQVEKAALELKNKNVDMIIMDCMGYNEKQKKTISRYVNIPVILSRSIVSRVAGELVNNN